MALKDIFGWNRTVKDPATACGAGDAPAACGAAEKPAACGAADK